MIHERIIVCGAREWTDKEAIRHILAPFPVGTLLAHGDNGKRNDNGEAVEGADLLAADVGEELGFIVVSYAAMWNAFKKAGATNPLLAGPARNGQMLHGVRPTRVIGFHDNIDNSKGTKHMLTIAKNAGIPVRLVSHRADRHIVSPDETED